MFFKDLHWQFPKTPESEALITRNSFFQYSHMQHNDVSVTNRLCKVTTELKQPCLLVTWAVVRQSTTHWSRVCGDAGVSKPRA